MYRDGKGVSKDYVEAYKWFLMAVLNGEQDAQVEKVYLSKIMKSSQIEEAQRRAKEYLGGDKRTV